MHVQSLKRFITWLVKVLNLLFSSNLCQRKSALNIYCTLQLNGMYHSICGDEGLFQYTASLSQQGGPYYINPLHYTRMTGEPVISIERWASLES